MQIIKNLNEIDRIEKKTAVALGNFDGIHLGHKAILEDAVACAKENNLLAACYTFANHPLNYFLEKSGRRNECIKLICTEEEKLAMLEEMGFDIVINAPFNEEIMHMRAHDFIVGLLKEKFNASIVCCGFNYSFGVKAEGNVDMLRKEGSELGIEVRVHDAVSDGDTVISSTEIRKLISKGDMETLEFYLGRPYSISGTVNHGMRIGRTIGFPTMNLATPIYMALPPNGVYFTEANISGEKYPSITNIGMKPTVGGDKKSIETFIFGFDEDVYGKDVKIDFLKFERPETKFENIDDLKKQIDKDCKLAFDYHERRKNDFCKEKPRKNLIFYLLKNR